MLFLPLVLTPIARLCKLFVRTSQVSEVSSETVSSFTPRDSPPQSKKSNNFSDPELETFYTTTGFLLHRYTEGTSAPAMRFFLSQHDFVFKVQITIAIIDCENLTNLAN